MIRITSILREAPSSFVIISRFLLKMRNVSDKSCRENLNAHFMFNNFFFFFLNLAVYEIMWRNIVELGKPRMTIWRMRIACWLPKATCEETAGWLIASAVDWLRTVHNICDESIKFVITNWSIIKCSISAFIWRSSCKLSQGSRDSFPARSVTSSNPLCPFLWCWNLNQRRHSPSQDTF